VSKPNRKERRARQQAAAWAEEVRQQANASEAAQRLGFVPDPVITATTFVPDKSFTTWTTTGSSTHEVVTFQWMEWPGEEQK
jgi:hypothetical protein